jgi:quercetin dioxygenase-like cupin family protein
MPPTIARAHTMRRTETPNAVMTTLASPTQGPSNQLSMWRVDMQAGQRGPLHVFDSEQLWHVLAGQVEVVVEGPLRLSPGDAVVFPAGAERQVIAITDAQLIVCGFASAVAFVPGEEAPRGVPAWVS